MTHFQIKDHEYVPALVVTDEMTEVAVHLFSVIVRTPHMGTQTHYVLARDADKAAGMARCAMGCASYDIGEHLNKEIRTDATQLPLSVEGWGRNKV